MRLTFKIVTAKNADKFTELVNYWISQGYKFMAGQPVLIDRKGKYSLAMLLEEEV